MYITQVGLKRDVTPQAAELLPTARDEQAKATEGEEPVAMRTTTNGDIEAGRWWFICMKLGKGRHQPMMYGNGPRFNVTHTRRFIFPPHPVPKYVKYMYMYNLICKEVSPQLAMGN